MVGASQDILQGYDQAQGIGKPFGVRHDYGLLASGSSDLPEKTPSTIASHHSVAAFPHIRPAVEVQNRENL